MSWFFFLIGSLFYSCSLGLRHSWFQTSAWDLGIFDQATYLIAQGLPAKSSLLGFHILGDHGALVIYPLAWASKLFPSVFFLFFIQGIALASGVFPLARLAQDRGLTSFAKATSLSVFLLYPVIFNTAIFDFHPEVIAVPLIIEALVQINNKASRNPIRIYLFLLLALTCKVSISFLVFGIGVWLSSNNRKRLGIGLITLSLIWLSFMGGWLIPKFGGEEANLIRHLGKFGVSNGTDLNIEAWPSLLVQLIKQFFSIANAEYIFLLLLPVTYLLMHIERKKIFLNLTPFAPLMLLNLIAAEPALKDLVHHYSLFLVPLITIEVLKTLAPGKNGRQGYPSWMQSNVSKIILVWAVITFILLSRLTFFFGPFQTRVDASQDRKEAMALINPDAALLTSSDLVPHLSRRKIIGMTNKEQLSQLNLYDQILLDMAHPGWQSSEALVLFMDNQLTNDLNWRETYRKGDVVLYEKLKK